MNHHRACDDFHRSSGGRRTSGAGLTRRQVLGPGSAAAWRCTPQAMPIQRVFEAAAAEAAAAPNAPVLVSVFLPGGVDLLDTLVPLHNYGRYADLHPKLKVRGVPLGSTGLGLNPSLARASAAASRGCSSAASSASCPGSTTPTRTSPTSTRATSGRPA